MDAAGNLFTVFGQPDIDIGPAAGGDGEIQVEISSAKQDHCLRVFMLAYGRHPSQWPSLEPLVGRAHAGQLERRRGEPLPRSNGFFG